MIENAEIPTWYFVPRAGRMLAKAAVRPLVGQVELGRHGVGEIDVDPFRCLAVIPREVLPRREGVVRPADQDAAFTDVGGNAGGQLRIDLDPRRVETLRLKRSGGKTGDRDRDERQHRASA